jgi:hypothetical protein
MVIIINTIITNTIYDHKMGATIPDGRLMASDTTGIPKSAAPDVSVLLEV